MCLKPQASESNNFTMLLSNTMTTTTTTTTTTSTTMMVEDHHRYKCDAESIMMLNTKLLDQGQRQPGHNHRPTHPVKFYANFESTSTQLFNPFVVQNQKQLQQQQQHHQKRPMSSHTLISFLGKPYLETYHQHQYYWVAPLLIEEKDFVTTIKHPSCIIPTNVSMSVLTIRRIQMKNNNIMSTRKTSSLPSSLKREQSIRKRCDSVTLFGSPLHLKYVNFDDNDESISECTFQFDHEEKEEEGKKEECYGSPKDVISECKSYTECHSHYHRRNKYLKLMKDKTRKCVSFAEVCIVVEIPHYSEYPHEQQEQIWTSLDMIEVLAERNTFEFSMEGEDWVTCIEDESFLQNDIIKIHPALIPEGIRRVLGHINVSSSGDDDMTEESSEFCENDIYFFPEEEQLIKDQLAEALVDELLLGIF